MVSVIRVSGGDVACLFVCQMRFPIDLLEIHVIILLFCFFFLLNLFDRRDGVPRLCYAQIHISLKKKIGMKQFISFALLFFFHI